MESLHFLSFLSVCDSYLGVHTSDVEGMFGKSKQKLQSFENLVRLIADIMKHAAEDNSSVVSMKFTTVKEGMHEIQLVLLMFHCT
jgi:aspartate ammonia-lyase